MRFPGRIFRSFIFCILLISGNRASFFEDLLAKGRILGNAFRGGQNQDDDANKVSEKMEEGYSSRDQLPILKLGRHNLQIYDMALDMNDTHHMYWQVDYATTSVRIEIHSRVIAHHPWFAVGFSDYGELGGSDLCIFWTDWRGRTHFQNALVDSNGRLTTPLSRECRNFRHKIREGVLKFSFSRRFDTCLPDHYVLEKGTTHVVWARGEGPLYRLEGVLAKGDDQGMVRVELLKPILPSLETKETNDLEVTSKALSVPDEETTYWCTVHKLPKIFENKHHIFKFGPQIQQGNEDIVHHMEVFHCEHPKNFKVPMYQGPCHADDRPVEIDACKRVMAAWAMGAEPFAYPEEAGLTIGGKDFNPFVMLEVHYNNPNRISGRVDSSGMRLTYSSKLRQYDVGIMELGLEYISKMAIPPLMKSFNLAGYCIPECTAVGIPPNGVYIFGSQLHTHLTGVRTWTLHYRRDEELPELNRDNHYSTHFQEIRRLPQPVHVLPGDALVMGCEYDTIGRLNVTVGGFAITDEMCINYVHYYPLVELEVCKSSIDSKTLIDYFDFLNRMELQNTSPELDWRENYQAIDWTPLRSEFLQQLYIDAPLSMQCNRSSGERFPGFWENKPIPTVLKPWTPPERNCTSKGLM